MQARAYLFFCNIVRRAAQEEEEARAPASSARQCQPPIATWHMVTPLSAATRRGLRSLPLRARFVVCDISILWSQKPRPPRLALTAPASLLTPLLSGDTCWQLSVKQLSSL